MVALTRPLIRTTATGRLGDPSGHILQLCFFEPLFFNNMIMVLDRYFVHRLRMVTGKDGNPLNEVELLTEPLMNNGGVLRGNKVVKLVPEESVIKLNIGDRILLSEAQFERLAEAFFTEIERKFL